jgi:trans-2,3-dihydro-3-hydroxyanthranilate isomerase
MTGMPLSFDVVDVFTDRPFAGNQLAVVHDAGSLTAEACLAITREFSFSETVFPVPVDPVTGEYAVRIFTPGGEIPFAGHPTLGAAWSLRSRGLLRGTAAVQHCGAGEIPVHFGDESGDPDRVELSAVPRGLVGPLVEELVESALTDLGLSPTDLAGPVFAAGCGLTFLHVPVAETAVARATAATARPLHEYAAAVARCGALADPLEGINLVSVAGDGDRLSVHARVFVPGLLVPEDPATGSAAVGLGVALAAGGRIPDGGRLDITQGVEMGRPSRLYARAEVASGRATLCHVAGRVCPVMRGELAAP